METIYVNNIKELKKTLPELENKLNVKIILEGKKATIEGETLDEYEATMILDAISFGFTGKQALQLKNGEMSFKKINIKDFTKRTKLYEIRSRVIGREGKVKRTLESLSDSEIIIRGNEIGIIGSAESIDETITAISNLVRGSKIANVYGFLEKMNARKKVLDKE